MTSDDDARHIAELEARLRSAGLMPPPADLPSPAETDRLLDIVTSAWPKLVPAIDEPSDFRAGFSSALHFCCFVQRVDRLNQERGAGYFAGQANAWCTRYGIIGRISDKSFTAAAVASGIRTSALSRWPFDVEFALGLGTAAAPSNAWRSVLENGSPPPLELRRLATPVRTEMIFRAEPVTGTIVR
jgi:hypothetical protein